MPPTSFPELLEHLRSLPGAQRNALELLAVSEGGLTFDAVAKGLGRLGHAEEGRRYNSTTVRPLLHGLIDLGLARREGRIGALPDLVEPICRALMREGRYQPLFEIVATFDGRAGASGSWHRLHRHEARRELRRAVYAGDAIAYTRIVFRWREAERSLGPFPDIVRWVVAPLEVELLGRLPPEIAAPLLDGISRQRLASLIPLEPLAPLLDATCRAHPGIPLLQATAAREALLAGRLDDAQRLLADCEGGQCDAVRALLFLARGDVEASVGRYAKALAARRKREGGKVAWLDGPEGTLQPLAYLLSDKKNRHKQAKRLIEGTLKELWVLPSDPLGGHLHLSRLEAMVQGQPLPDVPPATHPYGVLVAALVSHWSSEPLDTLAIDKAMRRAEGAGLGWLRGELAVLFSGDRQQAVPGARPLASLRDPQSDWERRLHALEETLGKDPAGPASSQPKERVAWYLDEQGAALHLVARAQKRRASSWSAGRKVGVSRLERDPGSVPGMTEQDQRVAACLTVDRGRGWYRGSYTEELWNAAEAWKALAGHPAVFLLDEPDAQLDIVAERPQLVVSQQAAELVLRIEPEPKEGQAVVVQAPTPTRRTVFAFDGDQLRVVDLLRGGLRLPATASDRLGVLLARFTGLFEVHDDSTGLDSQARELTHDPRPVVRLTPQGAGLSAQLLVRPFGQGGPTVQPGKGGEVLLARIEGHPCQVRRDLDAELRLADALESGLPSLAAATWWGDARHLGEVEAALELLVELHALGDSVRLEWPEGEALRLRGEVGLEDLHLSVRGRDDWFEATGKLRVDRSLVLELHDLLDLLAERKRRFVRLDDGRFLALTDALRRQLDLLARIDQGRGTTTRFHRMAAAAVEPLVEGAGQVDVGQAWREQCATIHPAHQVPPPVPRTLQAELRPYQREGFTWMARLAAWGAGACLADDMGLGKTVQALALLLSRASLGPALVVAPTSVCGGWCEQAWRFAPTLTVHRFGAGDRQRMLEGLGPGQVVVCSYGLLQSEVERLTALTWSTLVLDEAQAVKNPQTRRHKAVARLEAGFRLATTGTPVENHIGELWALFRILQPGLLGSWERFRARFGVPIESGDREVQGQLRQLLLPFVLRRTKAAVLQDLPPRTDIRIDVNLHREETAVYEALRERAEEELEELPEGPVPLQVLAWLTKLRMACCNARLVLPTGQAPPSAKLEAFEEITEQLRAGGHRALVFSQFVTHLTLLRESLDARGLPYQYLDGSTPAATRDRRVQAFQAGEGDFFLISLRAGGFGLNLTAADYVLHMDPWWNPAVEDQASDRAHRIGQTRPVTVYRVVAKGSIEEKILDLHQRKRDLADRLLEGADAAATLSTAELMDLIRAT